MKIACEHFSTWNVGRYTVVSDSYFTKQTRPTEQLSEQTVGMLCINACTTPVLYMQMSKMKPQNQI